MIGSVIPDQQSLRRLPTRAGVIFYPSSETKKTFWGKSKRLSYSNEGCEALRLRRMWIGVAELAARHLVKFYWPASSFLRSSCGVFSVDQVSSSDGEGGVSQSPRWIFTFAMKFAEMGAVTNRNPMISNSWTDV